MKRVKKNFLVFILFSTLLVSAGLFSGCIKTDSSERQVYSVATGSNYAPFAYMNEESGELAGFDIELIKAIAKEADFDIRFEIVDWDGFITAMQTGRFDIGINGVTITEERKERIDFSNPYYSAGLLIMVQAGNEDIKSEQDLYGKKIGTLINSTSYSYLLKNHPNSKIYTFLGSSEVYMDLSHGRVDAVLYDAPSIKYYIAKKGGDRFKVVGELLQGEEYGIVFPKGSPRLEEVNLALSRVIEKGIYDDLYEKWFNERPYGTK